jgi:hypothetical protein
VGPRAVLGIVRIDKFLSIAGSRTLDCLACSLVTILTMLCHLHYVPNKIKFGHDMCSGKECGHKLVSISDDIQAQSNCKILTKLLLDDF